MAGKDFRALTEELALLEKLIRQTHDLRQRRLLHMRAWEILQRLQTRASA